LYDENGVPSRRSVEARILIAGLVLVVVLLLWEFYIDEIREVEQEWRSHIIEKMREEIDGFALITDVPMSFEEYFSPYGLNMLIPHDLLLLAYSAAVILSVISIILLAQALIALENKASRQVKYLTEKGMKYFRWVLTLVIFFIVVNWMEESLFPFGSMFQENMWIVLGIATIITVLVRATLGKLTAKRKNIPA
jgi:hypothetical protein